MPYPDHPSPGAQTDAAGQLPAPRSLILSEKGEVSLFPFMSILASLIGILTLLIALSMAANQRKEGMTQEEVDRAQQFKSLEFLVKKKRDELELAKKDLEKNNLTALELEKLKKMLLELEKQKSELDQAKLAPEDELKAKIQLYTEEKVVIEKEQPVLQKKIEELNAKLAQLKEIPEPKEAVKINPPRMGVKAPRHLFFIECNSSGIVLRGANDKDIPVSFESVKAGTSVEYAEFVGNAKKSSGDDYAILFLVRKGGRLAYEYANAAAELDFKAKTAKLPIPNDGKIDLSLFRLKNL
jgi:hypothetical protein